MILKLFSQQLNNLECDRFISAYKTFQVEGCKMEVLTNYIPSTLTDIIEEYLLLDDLFRFGFNTSQKIIRRRKCTHHDLGHKYMLSEREYDTIGLQMLLCSPQKQYIRSPTLLLSYPPDLGLAIFKLVLDKLPPERFNLVLYSLLGRENAKPFGRAMLQYAVRYQLTVNPYHLDTAIKQWGNV